MFCENHLKIKSLACQWKPVAPMPKMFIMKPIWYEWWSSLSSNLWVSYSHDDILYFDNGKPMAWYTIFKSSHLPLGSVSLTRVGRRSKFQSKAALPTIPLDTIAYAFHFWPFSNRLGKLWPGDSGYHESASRFPQESSTNWLASKQVQTQIT